MGIGALGPSISEIAYFLERYAPDVVRRLKSNGAEFDKVLEPGISLGDKEVAAGALEPNAVQSIRIKAKVLSEALAPLIAKSQDSLASVDSRLKKLSGTKFLSGLVTLASAPGTVALLSLGMAEKAMLTSLLACAGSVIQLSAATLILGRENKEADLVNKGRVLAKAIAYGELTRKTLDAMLEANAPTKDIEQILKDANRYFGELNAALE